MFIAKTRNGTVYMCKRGSPTKGIWTIIILSNIDAWEYFLQFSDVDCGCTCLSVCAPPGDHVCLTVTCMQTQENQENFKVAFCNHIPCAYF